MSRNGQIHLCLDVLLEASHARSFLAAAAAAKNGVVETLESILFCFDVSVWMDTLLGSNISPPKVCFKMIFLFPGQRKNGSVPFASFILLMEETVHHLGCIKPCR